MTSIKHILVPTDGSEGAIRAAAYAGELAEAVGASVTLLYVEASGSLLSNVLGLAEFAGGVPPGVDAIEKARVALEKRAQENELPETSQALERKNLERQLVTVSGHPAQEIVAYVEENGVDQVVIGSHGSSGLQRAFLGSVSQAVANQVSCPVTIVR